MRYNNCSVVIYYILNYTLEKKFDIKIKAQKYVRDKKPLFKYFN